MDKTLLTSHLGLRHAVLLLVVPLNGFPAVMQKPCDTHVLVCYGFIQFFISNPKFAIVHVVADLHSLI